MNDLRHDPDAKPSITDGGGLYLTGGTITGAMLHWPDALAYGVTSSQLQNVEPAQSLGDWMGEVEERLAAIEGQPIDDTVRRAGQMTGTIPQPDERDCTAWPQRMERQHAADIAALRRQIAALAGRVAELERGVRG